MASGDETPTSNTQQLLAQVIETLSATTRREDKTLDFDSHQNDFDESGEMRRVIREELQQIVSEEPRHFDCFSRQFSNHRNLFVLIVVGMDTHNVTARRIQTRNVTMSVIAGE